MSLHISNATRRSAPMAPQVQDRLARIMTAHQTLPTPVQVGRVMGIGAGKAEPS
jgi:acyl-CoA thioester hydrolase